MPTRAPTSSSLKSSSVWRHPLTMSFYGGSNNRTGTVQTSWQQQWYWHCLQPGDYRYYNTTPATQTLPGCRTCSILEQRAPLPRLACPQVASGFCAVPQGIRRWLIWGLCCSNYNRSCGATNGGRPLTVIVLWVSWNLTSQQFYFLETILLLA